MHKLDNATAALLFRVIRELSINVIKHAHATQLTISFQNMGEQLVIKVIDDGIGYSEARQTNASKHCFGLFSIRERIWNLNGKLEIQSDGQPGTCVCVSIPISNVNIEN